MKNLFKYISIVSTVVLFSLGAFIYYLPAASVTKGLIAKDDLALWDGTTTKTVTRSTSTGYSITLNKIDNLGVDIFQSYGGGVNRNSTTIAAALTAVGAVNNVSFFAATGTWQLTQSHTLTSNIFLNIPPGAIFDTDMSIRSSSYIWIKSTSGTNEYYCQATGGTDPGLSEPTDVIQDGVAMTAGAVGSLAVTEWDFDDNDTLGYDTVYVRLTDSTDPDGKAAGYVEAAYTLTVYSPEHITAALSQSIETGDGSIAFTTNGIVGSRWHYSSYTTFLNNR